MPTLAQTDDFKSIVLRNTPLIDVRAPIEFDKGAFANAINLPLMNDDERRLVGIKYKEEGNEQALKLGHKLVSGDAKEQRISAWLDFIRANPDAKLYCFRGGQRSKISQEWIAQTQKEIVRLKGGYKAFRNYLTQEIEDAPNHFKAIVLGGRTGSGKTLLLNEMRNSIDLERLANHRGSTFGRKLSPQPTQINFENNLAYDLIQKINKGFEYLVFEDEGKRVGGVYMPPSLAEYLSRAPLVLLEAPDEERIEITFNEYIASAQESYKSMFGSEYLLEWKQDTQSAMNRISKRLGSQRYQILCDIFKNAFNEQTKNDALHLYKDWIAFLLREYYDPMYDYQIRKNGSRVVYRGSHEEIISYLKKL